MDTNNIKIKLEEERGVLQDELNSVAKKDENGAWIPVPGERDTSVADSNDVADRDEDYEERAALTNTLSKRLADVEASLSNIENNTYGMCTMCENKIEEDRLEANPSAQTCKACMNF